MLPPKWSWKDLLSRKVVPHNFSANSLSCMGTEFALISLGKKSSRRGIEFCWRCVNFLMASSSTHRPIKMGQP